MCALKEKCMESNGSDDRTGHSDVASRLHRAHIAR